MPSNTKYNDHVEELRSGVCDMINSDEITMEMLEEFVVTTADGDQELQDRLIFSLSSMLTAAENAVNKMTMVEQEG